MKFNISILALVAFLFKATGGEIVFPASTVCTVYTNTFYSTNYIAPTNNGVVISVTNVVWVAPAVYHTFHLFYTATGTNALTDIVDRSIDGSNWFPWITNTGTASFNYETNAVGTWLAFRRRTVLLATNATLVTKYMGK